MRNIATITWLTFHEAWRRWMVVIALALGVLFVALYALGLAFVLEESQKSLANAGVRRPPAAIEEQGADFLLLAGMYVVHFLTVMLAIFAAIDAVSGEIGSNTIQAIATKPIGRWQIILGKWLGYSGMLIVYVGLLTGGIMLAISRLLNYTPPNVLPAFGILALEALSLLSLSLLIGTRLSALTNGVLLFMLYGIAFVGSWIAQIGSIPQLHAKAAVDLGNATALLLPVEALWRLASYQLQPPLLHGQFNSPFASLDVPDEGIIYYAATYAVVMLALAIWSFSRRDL
ncbi:MAG: ABC transporter permease [Chloroflexia bacterium]